jgi:hypothetical protein
MCFRSDKDDAGRQFDPTEIAAATAIQTPGDAAELGEKGVSPLDSAADATHSWLTHAATLGRLHPKARRVGAVVGGAVAIGAVGTSMGQIPRVWVVHRGFSGWRLHDHRFQDLLGLHAIVGSRLGHDDAQRQTVFLSR